jgi:hypothetical protein
MDIKAQESTTSKANEDAHRASAIVLSYAAAKVLRAVPWQRVVPRIARQESQIRDEGVDTGAQLCCERVERIALVGAKSNVTDSSG